jgi:hypothetical protein
MESVATSCPSPLFLPPPQCTPQLMLCRPAHLPIVEIPIPGRAVVPGRAIILKPAPGPATPGRGAAPASPPVVAPRLRNLNAQRPPQHFHAVHLQRLDEFGLCAELYVADLGLVGVLVAQDEDVNDLRAGGGRVRVCVGVWMGGGVGE